MVRLAGGVVPGPDQGVWLLDPAGLAMHARQQEIPPDTPVAVGPRSAPEATVQAALEAMNRWVSRGGGIVAGADIDLGEGFRSASTDGGAGDRRDSVLAALSVPGLAQRLGERSSVLVALLGPPPPSLWVPPRRLPSTTDDGRRCVSPSPQAMCSARNS
jgi:hypothetical protein